MTYRNVDQAGTIYQLQACQINLLRLIAICLIVSLHASVGYAASDAVAPDTIHNNQINEGNQPTGFINDSNNVENSSKHTPEKLETLPSTLTEYAAQKLTSPQPKDALSPKTRMNNELTGEYNNAYYELAALNSGLPPLSPEPNLQTPLATLEFFHTAMMKDQFSLATYALNLNPIPVEKQINTGLQLTKKLDYLLSENGLYVFDDLPDRADGLVEPAVGSSNPIAGIPRRSLKLGYIDYKNRRVPIFIERVHVSDKSPVWVFSAQTVGNIELLYDLHQPAEFEVYLPDWMTKELLGISIWEGIALLVFMIITLGLGYIISKSVAKLVEKYSDWHKQKSDDSDEQALSLQSKGLTDLFNKITVPLTITISFGLLFALVSGILPKVHPVATSTRPIIWLGLVFSGLWLGIRSINFFANRYQDFQIDSLDKEQFNKQRVRLTYLSVFRRIFIFVMILGSIWVSLAEFADLEGLGTTLLTSAGIAGAVIGIAAQPTLGNIIAGFQVAITQPVRIGDTIMLDGVWSEVEDLRYTYAVLKTWDDRRLIVPMKYFVTEVLENWSHTNIKQSSAIYLYVDYGADIDAINNKFLDVVKSNELWDQESEPNLLVTSVTPESIKLRCKVSAESPADAWALECDVRKQMLDYLVSNQRDYLPTERITLAPRYNN